MTTSRMVRLLIRKTSRWHQTGWKHFPSIRGSWTYPLKFCHPKRQSSLPSIILYSFFRGYATNAKVWERVSLKALWCIHPGRLTWNIRLGRSCSFLNEWLCSMLIFQGASQLVHLFFCSKNHVSSSLQLHPTHLFSMYRSDHCLRSEALKSTRVGEEAMVTEKRGWKFGDGHQFPKLKEGLFFFFLGPQRKTIGAFSDPCIRTWQCAWTTFVESWTWHLGFRENQQRSGNFCWCTLQKN